MILVDFSQIVIASFRAAANDSKLDANGARTIVLRMLLKVKRNYGKKYGKMILCVDSTSGKRWRTELFPHYKANRKKLKDKDRENWDTIVSLLGTLVSEFSQQLPYAVIQVDGCEADDVIAIMTECSKNPVLIVSGDQDFLQLHKNDRVKQWSPIQKKMLTVDDAGAFLQEKILRGDDGDGVPNVLSDDDTFVDSDKKQKPMTQKRLDELKEKLVFGGIDAQTRLRYERNRKMVDLSQIPTNMKTKILTVATAEMTSAASRPRSGIMNYLIENGMGSLVPEIGDL